MKKRIGLLLSGRGSNFEALAESVGAGHIPDAEIAIVVSNREGAEGIEKARRGGINARVIPSKGLEREAYDKLVVAALQEKKVDLVCLAGYMRLLSPHFVAAFPQRILNIHPSLLPAFPGLELQQAGVAIEDADTPETLAARILREEHRIYTAAVRIVLEGRYRMEGRRVLLNASTGLERK